MLLKSVLVLALFVVSSVVFSEPPKKSDEPTFGIEQEIKHPFLFLSVAPIIDGIIGRPAKEYEVMANMAVKSYLRLLQQQAKKYPGEMEIQGDRVYYPKFDWGFKVTPDYATLELIFEPIPLSKATAMKEILQRDVWDLPKKINLKPYETFSAGHVHIGLNHFNNDPRLFMNYLIDFANHPALAYGVFNAFDPLNAAPPLQDEASKKEFRKIIEDFDSGKIKTIEEIRGRVSKLTGYGKPRASVQGGLNVKTKYPTIEFRAVRAHRNADELVAFLELQTKRINHLKGVNGRLEYHEPVMPMTAEHRAAQFHAYVTSMGADWDRYKKLMSGDLQDVRIDPSKAFPKEGKRNTSMISRCILMFRQMF